MSVYDIPIADIDGNPDALARLNGKLTLMVNVASKCGLTPQYEALERLYRTYGPRGFAVAGFPCNQFQGQEPGTPSEIKEFCSANYDVSFPLFEKIEVNGPGRHPLYSELTRASSRSGYTGDIRWNFEKFLVSPDGAVVARFAPQTPPDDPAIISEIEARLPA